MRQAAIEPIVVEVSKHPTAVILSYAEYERLTQLEDDFWAARAEEAEKSGYLGPDESMRLLKEGIDRAKTGSHE
jgi:hypothetical protein